VFADRAGQTWGLAGTISCGCELFDRSYGSPPRGKARCAIEGRPMTDQTKYLDEDAVADLLSISVRTVQRWRGTGEGPPFVRAGARRVIYSRAAIDQWAASRTFAHHAAEITGTAG